jgi:hypothetical protein
MCEAGKIILDGFELRTDAEVVVYPNRYSDERGVEMWGKVNGILADLTKQNTSGPETTIQPTSGEFVLGENFVPSDTRETGPGF